MQTLQFILVFRNYEAGENSAQKGCKSAIEDEAIMEATKVLLRQQKQFLRTSHHKIKDLKVMVKA